MGVDTRLTLPPGTRAGDLADAIGALLGCVIDAERPYGPEVHGPEVKPADLAGSVCSHISVKATDTKWDRGVAWLLHHEWGSDSTRSPKWPGSIGMMASAAPFQIAMFRRLAEIFGGVVDYNDCDSEDADYAPDEPEVARAWRTEGYTDEKWLAMRRHVTVDVEPLTAADVKACIKIAAYDRPPFAKQVA